MIRQISQKSDTGLEALYLLLAHRLKRLPVVNADGRLVGLVGRGGVLQADETLAEALTPHAHILMAY